jgi:hypothetical protein
VIPSLYVFMIEKAWMPIPGHTSQTAASQS